ncbi:MAG TPA: AAA family ATPase [Chloroflexota bacterium]
MRGRLDRDAPTGVGADNGATLAERLDAANRLHLAKLVLTWRDERGRYCRMARTWFKDGTQTIVLHEGSPQDDYRALTTCPGALAGPTPRSELCGHVARGLCNLEALSTESGGPPDLIRRRLAHLIEDVAPLDGATLADALHRTLFVMGPHALDRRVRPDDTLPTLWSERARLTFPPRYPWLCPSCGLPGEAPPCGFCARFTPTPRRRASAPRVAETPNTPEATDRPRERSQSDPFSLTRATASRLAALPQRLRERIKGQDEAIDELVRIVRNAVAGVNDPERPLGVILLAGPSGCGKTATVKALAEELGLPSEAFKRFDMAEFMERHSLNRLIGAPPGYVGYDDGGELTGHLLEHPAGVMLFDEFEKADPQISRLLLGLFDEGRVTDSRGVTADGRRYLYVLTTNVGAHWWTSPEGQRLTQQERAQLVREELRRLYPPEFINRLSGVVCFNDLPRPVLVEIARGMLASFQAQQALRGVRIEYGDGVADLVVERGAEPGLGARPLGRAIDRLIRPIVGDAILAGVADGQSPEGLVVRVERRGDDLVASTVRRPPEAVDRPKG